MIEVELADGRTVEADAADVSELLADGGTIIAGTPGELAEVDA